MYILINLNTIYHTNFFFIKTNNISCNIYYSFKKVLLLFF